MTSKLLEAVERGNVKEVRQQLDLHDVDTRAESQDVNKYQAMHLAARGGHVQIMQALLARCDKDGPTNTDDALRPLHVAVRYGHIDAVDVLIKAG